MSLQISDSREIVLKNTRN